MRMFHKYSFVLQLFCVLFISMLPLNITSSPTTEAEALLKWKNSLVPSSSHESWSINNIESLCDWTGIACNTAGTISVLNLSGRGLNGTLAHFNFSSFLNLSFLDLSSNLFSGSVPGEIGSLEQLQHLNFFDNYFSGTIPYQISRLQKLQYLDFGSNNFVDPNWSAFLDMPYLTHLGLSYNQLAYQDIILS